MKILITGATSGIGRAAADSLARQGHSVVGLARRLREPLLDWRLKVCDVLDYGALERLRDTLAGEGWSPDALICCAASLASALAGNAEAGGIEGGAVEGERGVVHGISSC
jgi:NAD(P)-dependent dehydrogenase (short-subunit alcohol dehydrogenase family)